MSVGRTAIPQFLKFDANGNYDAAGKLYKPSFHHSKKAWLVGLTGIGLLYAIPAAFNSSPEVALAKKVQEYVMNLSTLRPTLTQVERKNIIKQALTTLKQLKASKANSKDAATINSIIINLFGMNGPNQPSIKVVFDDMLEFTTAYGNGTPRVHNVANLNYEETEEALKKLETLKAKVKALDDNDAIVAFDKDAFIQDDAAGNHGIASYEAALKARMTALKAIVTTQRTELTRIIKEAASIRPDRHQLSLDLTAVRGHLGPITGANAFKALGMSGFNNDITSYLDAVGKFVRTGYASTTVSNSPLGSLSKKKASLWEVVAGSVGFSVAGAATLAVQAATTGMTVGLPLGIAMGAGAITTLATNYLRGGILYQWTCEE